VLAALQSQFGVGLNGLVLISPVMDYSTFRGARHHATTFINALPTIAAAAREAQGRPVANRAELKDIEEYARGEFLLDLMRGPRDPKALDRLVSRVAALSNLPETVVRRYGAKLDEAIYIREANRAAGKTASGYDTSVTGDDADPTAYYPAMQDPFGNALAAPIKSSMLDLYTEKLNFRTEHEYHLLSMEANGAWVYAPGRPAESFTQLRAAMALDPRLRVLVTHGFTDLRTPFFASQLLLEQLPAFADGRVDLKVYPGGHMHYSRSGSRVALRRDVEALIGAAIAADPARAGK
jgi:carboxypeptidase C (cathepsin A)